MAVAVCAKAVILLVKSCPILCVELSNYYYRHVGKIDTRTIHAYTESSVAPDFGSSKSEIQLFFSNPAKSGSGQIFSRIW